MKLRTILFCTLSLSVSTAAMAQQPSKERPQRVAATVVLVDSIAQPDAPFVVLRRPGTTPMDLILVRAGADAAQLSEAVRGLLSARQATGDFPMASATFRVRPHQRAGADTRLTFPWAPRVLNDLRRAEPREISGVGRVRAVEIWLPRQGNGRRPRA